MESLNNRKPKITEGWHISYWHAHKFQLIGITYYVKTIQEALLMFEMDRNTPTADKIKYILAVDGIDFKNLIKHDIDALPSNKKGN